MIHSIHKQGDILHIYFCVIFHETRCHAQVHVTSGALVHCALSLAVKRTQMAEQWVDFAVHCLLWLLLLRLPAVVPLLLLPQNNLTSLAFAPDSELVSANRISHMAFSSFIYFFPAIAWDPQTSALFTTMCDSAQFQKRNTIEYERPLQWQQNRSKATMWLLYKNSSYSRVPKMLLHWQLYVAC